MSTLTEIEAAAAELSDGDKIALVRFLIELMPPQQGPLPKPREFSLEEMNAWMEEDAEAGREFRARQAAAASPVS